MSLPAARYRAKNVFGGTWRIKYERFGGCENLPGLAAIAAVFCASCKHHYNAQSDCQHDCPTTRQAFAK
jgi:hypothetical protein